ncbi:MAG: AEC family transporter [Eubacteriales bacterium]|nr:AEC family transporter [Eubacteriales bacterium]
MAYTLIQQVIIMFLLAFVGYLMFRTGKITPEGSKSLANILLYLSLPCVIINGFQLEYSHERLIGLLLSSLLSLIVLVMSILISRLFFRRNVIESFSAAFSNPGFFGIPLILATLSDGSVFYIASFIAFLNLFQWTYGVSLMTKEAKTSDKKGSFKKSSLSQSILQQLLKLIKAPFMIAIIIGLFFFLSGFQMPVLLNKCVTQIANLNTPIAMFTIGIYLAQTDIFKMFLKPRLYLVALVRMIVIPVAAMLLLSLVPNTWLEMKLAILIAAACPVGSNVAVYAQLHNNDYLYAVETVVLSTLFSIITIPVLITLANNIWA